MRYLPYTHILHPFVSSEVEGPSAARACLDFARHERRLGCCLKSSRSRKKCSPSTKLRENRSVFSIPSS